MVAQYNTHVSNMNNYKYIKAKQDNIQIKATKFKKQTEKEEKLKTHYESKLEKENLKNEKLKKKLEQLEIMEERALVKLKNTMLNKGEEIAQLNVSRKLNFGINSSTISNGENGLEESSKSSRRLEESKFFNSDLRSVSVNLVGNKGGKLDSL
jgi:hypothetical protein